MLPGVPWTLSRSSHFLSCLSHVPFVTPCPVRHTLSCSSHCLSRCSSHYVQFITLIVLFVTLFVPFITLCPVRHAVHHTFSHLSHRSSHFSHLSRHLSHFPLLLPGPMKDARGCPRGFLRDTQGVPELCPRVAQICPEDTLWIPKGWPRVPWRCPGVA